jgi:hypothetical protein
MYALLMAEQGLVGLALYLSLIGLLTYKGWQLTRGTVGKRSKEVGVTLLIYAAFIAAFGFVSHNVLEDSHGMFVLAFMVAISRCVQGGVREDAAC